MICKKSLMLAAVLIGCLVMAGTSFGADQKIGIMNVQKIIVTCAAGKAAKEKVDSKMTELKATFKEEEDALKALQAEIKKKSSAWSEEKKAEKVREYQKSGRELQAKTEDARFELKQMQDKELEPILKSLEQVVQMYGKEKGYTLILDAKNGVLYFDSAIDVTDEVTKKLDEAMASK